MPIGSSKLGVLGAGLVPGGSVTFNTSGNWSVPPGVKKVSITGKGATGNPGNAGNAGNPGLPGLGGGGGGGSIVPGPYPCNVNYQSGGIGGGIFTVFPPNPAGFSGINKRGFGGSLSPQPAGTPLGQDGQAGCSGPAGQAGQAGQAGNPGQASSGLGNTFPGGAGGNAGTAGNAGNGGSGGVGGARGPNVPTATNNNVAGAPGSGGGGPGGESRVGAPGNNRNAAGGGGGGAGVTNDGGTGAGPPGPNTGSPNYQVGKGGTTSGFCVQTAFANPGQNPANEIPFSPGTSVTGGSIGDSNRNMALQGNAMGLVAQPGNTFPPAQGFGLIGVDYRCSTSPAPQAFQINNSPQRNSITRCNPAVRSGAGGGHGSAGQPNVRSANGGAAGGGRGNAGNPGGAGGGGGTGAAANPLTFNCVTVTPGATVPITVATPGGQVIISWNPQ